MGYYPSAVVEQWIRNGGFVGADQRFLHNYRAVFSLVSPALQLGNGELIGIEASQAQSAVILGLSSRDQAASGRRLRVTNALNWRAAYQLGATGCASGGRYSVGGAA